MTLPRDDLAAGLAARRELGPDYDAAFADVIAARFEEHLAARQGAAPLPAPAPRPLPRARRTGRDHSLTLLIVSLVISVPLTAISVSMGGPGAVTLVWLALVVLNVSYMHRPRRD
ncbi:hypothetical protein [Actinomadura rupiterrae]|uniref:hypothetical protein n=1 Tax=Actinomadura rupiterrae TaxID=559627 RepID=UPI0020A3E657|nr:hypothetical protein [Actinomadura rupiterrae]MCP2339061.1 hypothetical protein [Actinomadura rupiterrae]